MIEGKNDMRAVFKGVVVATLLVISTAALAEGYGGRSIRIGWHVRQPTRFMVSGVLRKNGSTDVIKPIQAILTADDGGAALQTFIKSAQTQYPGYALIATLVSPVPIAGTCENAI
ncbi:MULTISPECIES: hypothetical protein [Burkholderia]|uniref:Uncharacterized protein n=2 Tax=Burkholderia cepacia complex TaxID=87882 RepID=A0AAP4RBB1_9BURK|nr:MULTISPECIES: hypothetical protein [Burkholderia]MDN7570581.1 hypothetical protein [Burkholderia contaminans]